MSQKTCREGEPARGSLRCEAKEIGSDGRPQQNGDPLVGFEDRRSLVGWGIGEDELRV